MARGGKRPGAGRPAGSKGKRSTEFQETVAAAGAKIAAVLGEGAFTDDAHAFLMHVYKNPANDLPVRIDAAKAAIGYEKPKLASIEQVIDAEVHQRVISAEPMTDEEWEAQYGGAKPA
jgi:hypothetical protein